MKYPLIFLAVQFIVFSVPAQLGINTTGAEPENSAMLDVTSQSKGFLTPRMTSSQRDAIEDPARGLMIYNLDTDCQNYFSGTEWMEICGTPVSIIPAFVCGTSVGDVDDNIYSTIQIGTQCWFGENLKVANYRNNTPIPNITDDTQWINDITGAWSYYDNNPANNDIYGKLYNWYAVNNAGGLCPAGWHVPSEVDWCVLSVFLDEEAMCENHGAVSYTVSGMMKSTGNEYWLEPNLASNSSGFSCLPAGYRYDDGGFYDINGVVFIWSTDELDEDTTAAWMRGLYNYSELLFRDTSPKSAGSPVRCLKD